MAAEMAVPRRDDVLAAVEQLLARLGRHMGTTVEMRRRRLEELLRSYALGQVRGRIEGSMQRLDYALERLGRSMTAMVRERRAAVDRRMATLAALNPRDILTRGYTICADSEGRILRGRTEALDAESIRVTFHDGDVSAEVREKA
jgi:exodeoxyribonuclease VII large subunit